MGMDKKHLTLSLLLLLPFLGLEMSPLSGSWIASSIIWAVFIVLFAIYNKQFIKQIRIRSPIILANPNREYQPKSTPSWLEDVLHRDRHELGSRIISHVDRWYFEGVSETEPFIKVRIGVVNAAVFPVAITGLKGSLEIEGALCNAPATLEGGGGLLRLYRGVGFQIRQPISLETAQKIKAIMDKGDKVSVGFRECWVALQAKEPNHPTEPVYAGIVDMSGNVVSS